MQPWHGSVDPAEPVIDLGVVGDADSWEPPTPRTAAPPERPAARWLLVTVTVVVSVLATLAGTLLYQHITAEDPTTTVVLPATVDELRAWLTAENPEGADPTVSPAHLVELRHGRTLDLGYTVAPGTYRTYLRCGTLGTDGQSDGALRLSATLLTSVGSFDVVLPCPSTIVAMSTLLTFDELGAMQFTGYLSDPEDSRPFMLAVWLVPAAED